MNKWRVLDRKLKGIADALEYLRSNDTGYTMTTRDDSETISSILENPRDVAQQSEYSLLQAETTRADAVANQTPVSNLLGAPKGPDMVSKDDPSFQSLSPISRGHDESNNELDLSLNSPSSSVLSSEVVLKDEIIFYFKEIPLAKADCLNENLRTIKTESACIYIVRGRYCNTIKLGCMTASIEAEEAYFVEKLRKRYAISLGIDFQYLM